MKIGILFPNFPGFGWGNILGYHWTLKDIQISYIPFQCSAVTKLQGAKKFKYEYLWARDCLLLLLTTRK